MRILAKIFRVRVYYDFDQNLYSRVSIAIFYLLPGWPFKFACYAILVSPNENILFCIQVLMFQKRAASFKWISPHYGGEEIPIKIISFPHLGCA